MNHILRGTEVPKTTKYTNMKSRNRDRTIGYSKGQVQNVKSSRVYVFGENDVLENELENSDLEMVSIKSRNTKGRFKSADQNHEETILFDREINEGDSLQSLSVQFACSISELKRINRLIQDQDFFSLKYVKVPVKRYGILSEKLKHQKVHIDKESNGASYIGDMHYNNNSDMYIESMEPLLPVSESDSVHDFSDPEMQMKIIRTLGIKDNTSDLSNEADEFLKSMDKDLDQVRKASHGDKGSLHEVISVLTNKSIFPLTAKKPQHLNGADCGIRWWTILLIIVIIVIIFGYIVYNYWLKKS